MTRIEIDLDKGSLMAKGHAGYGERGQDIVCAAVSALTQTAAVAAKRHRGEVKKGDGHIEVQCANTEYTPVLEAIAEGLKMIARQYPLHVRVKVR